jgi:hypothetical protein
MHGLCSLDLTTRKKIGKNLSILIFSGFIALESQDPVRPLRLLAKQRLQESLLINIKYTGEPLRSTQNSG